MTTYLHLVSIFLTYSKISFLAIFFVLAGSAIARRERSASSSIAQFWDRIFKKTHLEVISSPRIISENGWTTILCDDYLSFKEWLGQDEEGIPPINGEPLFLGSHLLIELYGCKKEFLETENSVGNAMRQAAVESKATVVAESFHEFKPYGVSGAVIIQESHYTIHTWPEHGYAAVDLFYCGGTVQVHRAVELLQHRFQPDRIKFMVVRRGIQSEVQGH